MIVVIGAGLAGMSCAYGIEKRGMDCIVLEKSAEPGGLCRSYKSKNYTFDLAGHFLHLRTDEGKTLAAELMGDALASHDRRASVLTHGVRVPFPFQAHLGALPPEVNLECLLGFIEAHGRKMARRPQRFDRWVVDVFGKGMARHFFFPYNSKFFKRDLSRMLVDWTSWSIPRPDMVETVRGSLGMPNEGMGYNPTFLYPKRGGIGGLARALAGRLKNIRYNAAVKSVDARKKVVVISGGEEIPYRALVSTAPLPELASMTRGIDPTLRRAARSLEYISVDCVQIAVARPGVYADSWSYIPEAKYPFCRVGRYSGGGKNTRLYVEFTRRKDEAYPGDSRLIGAAVKGLASLGVLHRGDPIDDAHVVTLDPAYVVYDRRRRDSLPKILAALRKRRIHSIGRYGAWEYSAMEDALLAGARTALSL